MMVARTGYDPNVQQTESERAGHGEANTPHIGVYFKTSAHEIICCTSCVRLDIRDLEDTERSVRGAVYSLTA